MFLQKNFDSHPVVYVGSAIGVGFLGAMLLSKLRKTGHYDSEFTGAYPRFSGAVSSITGGPPEDMNGMPAAEEPEKEGPTYDGTQIRLIK